MIRLKPIISILLMAAISFTIILCNIFDSPDISVTPSSILIEQFETLHIEINRINIYNILGKNITSAIEGILSENYYCKIAVYV